MANPFYIDPTIAATGMQRGLTQLGQGLSSVAATVERVKQQRAIEDQAAQEQMAAEQAALAEQEAQQEIQNAFASGDSNLIASTMIKYPDQAKGIKDAIQFQSDATRDNFTQSAREIVLNPANTEQILLNRINMVQQQGGDPTETISALEQFKADPEAFQQSAKNVFATYDPTGYKSYMEAQPKIADAGTSPASVKEFDYYLQLKQSNPEQAEQYAKQLGIVTENPEIKKTTAMQNFDTWANLPDGPEKDAFAKMIGINPKESAKDIVAKAEKQAAIESSIESVDQTIMDAEALINDPGFDSYFGFSSVVPAIPGTEKANFTARFESFRNNLTLENLGKMSGVLTDKDIAILESAAAALKPGMSDAEAKKEMQKIVNRLKTQRASKQKQLGAISDEVQVPQALARPEYPAQQEDTQISDEELLSKYGL